MKKSLTKIVMITGATSGIGRATARIFAKKGYQLVLTGSKKGKLDEVSSKYGKKYVVKVKKLLFDSHNLDEAKHAFESLNPDWKNIDILVNITGLAKGFDYHEKVGGGNWQAMIESNIKGILFFNRLVLPFMAKQGKGQIINISSASGIEGPSNQDVYTSLKNAADSLTASMRKDLLGSGIRISLISSGYVDNMEFAGTNLAKDKAQKGKNHLLDPLTPRDVADVIYFVATRRKHVNIRDVSL